MVRSVLDMDKAARFLLTLVDGIYAAFVGAVPAKRPMGSTTRWLPNPVEPEWVGLYLGWVESRVYSTCI